MNILLLTAFIVLLVATILCAAKIKPEYFNVLIALGLTLWCSAQLFGPIVFVR